MDFILNGTAGFVLVDLALVSALIASVAYFASLRAAPQHVPGWQRMGAVAFVVHAVSVAGVVVMLLGLIYTHQYQYHYVWSHSSNELPVHFMLACLWEGQEGSFLIWMFWQAALGLVVLRTAGTWAPGVLAVVASVQAILASMVLGIFVNETTAKILLLLAVLVLLAYLYRRMRHQLRDGASGALLTSLALSAVAVATAIAMLRGLTGVGFAGLTEPAFLLQALVWLLAAGLFIQYAYRQQPGLSVTLAGVTLLLAAFTLYLVPLEGFKIGSSPFVLLRDVFAEEAVYKTSPDFVPSNGNGLNPLLQNYWMVIHPPTLFLGFALTLIPFAFVVAALVQRDYTGYIKPAAPWQLLSVMVLGVGIMMGGYWAYETLNFGGYWNWDPVENASLVPWLTGVAGLHTAVAYRHGRRYLHLGMGLIMATFLLVLYSTFLVRSGVLGEASVHSFTDLGLSGQLLLLLMAYVVGVAVLWAVRQRELPVVTATSTFWSRETFLLLAALTLIFAATQISLVTSLPVFNKIFGTKLAPPGRLQLFYYKWEVWFGILLALLSAIGQFVFWTRIEKTALQRTLFRSFLTAALATLVVMVLLFINNWQFAYSQTFKEGIEKLQQSGNTVQLVLGTAGYAVLMLADEMLLFCGLFTVLANLDIIVRLTSQNKANLKRTGGALAHIGFGLMLLGILFSSGYESTVSVNLRPQDLGPAFPEEARMDNVLLLRGQPTYVKGYRVTYYGKREAQLPLGPLQVIHQDAANTKVAFTDATGERFGTEFPAEFFKLMQGYVKPVNNASEKPELDLDKLKGFIESNLSIVKPKLLNNRSLYTLAFEPLTDSTRQFRLYPEAEVNERMGLVAHPARKVYWDRDLYVHVTSTPAPEADTARRKSRSYEIRLAVGDTARIEDVIIRLEKVVQVKDVPAFEKFDAVARAKLQVQAGGRMWETAPTFIVDRTEARHLDSRLDDLGMAFSFAGVDPQRGQVVLMVQKEILPPDYLTFKAISKPYINLLWLGTFVLTAGFTLAVARRVRENRNREAEAPPNT